MNDRSTFLYLIATREGGEFVAPVKVGVSNGPLGRLATLQTASPRDLGLVGMIEYPSRDIALDMEDAFHSTQKKNRIRGEWFDMPPTEAMGILRMQLRFGLSMFASGLTEDENAEVIELAERHL